MVIDALIVGAVITLLTVGIWQRVIERVIALVNETARTGAQPDFGLLAGTEIITTGEALLFTAVQLGVGLAYHVLFLRLKGATPGKLVTGLRVVRVDQGRSTKRLGWGPVTLRALVWLVPTINGLLAVVRLVDALFPLWQPKRQSLHDLVARTQVVRIR